MIRKLVVVVLAVLINCIVLAGLFAHGPTGLTSASLAQPADAIPTLPTITVRPTQAQIEALHHGVVRPAQAS